MIQDIIVFLQMQMEPAMLPFSVPIAICMLYWILMIVGLLDMELIDSIFGVGDGLADGAADGVVDGLADGAADGLVDGATDVAADGLADGAADSAGDGLDAAGESANVLAAFMGFLNFGHAPATIIITLFSLFMWVLANLGHQIFTSPAGVSGFVLFGIFLATFAVSFIASSILTHFSGKPFRRLMAICTYRGEIHLVGKVCEIRSSKVTAKNGVAELTLDGGSPLRLNVICDHENELKKGNKAVIIDYEKAKDHYIVEPMF